MGPKGATGGVPDDALETMALCVYRKIEVHLNRMDATDAVPIGGSVKHTIVVGQHEPEVRTACAFAEAEVRISSDRGSEIWNRTD